MIRNLKALGLALVAVVALSAMAASSASAVDKVTTTPATAVLTGVSHVGLFRITNPSPISIQCTTSKYAAKVTSGASEITVETTFEGTLGVTPHVAGEHCNFTGGARMTVDMNGCDFDLTGNTTQSDPPVVGNDAVVSLTCPVGAEVVITTNVGCNLKMPAQTPTTGGVRYTNKTASTVEVDVTSTGVTYTTEGALCGFLGLASEANNADYIDTVVMSSNAWVSGTKHPFTEGAAGTVQTS
jgi:hypothetical protein